MRRDMNGKSIRTSEKKESRLIACVLVLVMVVGLLLPPRVVAADGERYDVSTDSTNITNLMNQFGFIGFTSVETQGHQHMNMATKKLNGNGGEYAIRAKYANGTSTNYIQNPSNDSVLKIGYNRDTLIVGPGHTVTKQDGAYYVDGKKIDAAGNVWAETETRKYMDLDQLQINFQAYVNQLSKMNSSVTVNNKKANANDVMVDLSDQNNQKIQVSSSSETKVINLTPQDFANVKNGVRIDFTKNGTSSILVLNIDMKGATTFDCKQFYTKVEGIEYDTGESVWNKSTNRVYLNFYDSTKPNGAFIGSVKIDDASTGTIIAPYAKVTVGSNWCGMIVADQIVANGQSHRTNPYNAISAIGVDDKKTTEQKTTEDKSTEDKTSEDKSTEDKTSEDKSTEDKTTEDKSTEDKTSEDKTSEDKTTEDKTTEQKTTEQKTTEQKTTEQKTTEQKTTEQKTTEQKTTETATEEIVDDDEMTDSDKGKVVITVIDEKTKEPVPGATVEVTSPDGKKETIVTNTKGQRELKNRKPGTYTIKVKKVPDGYHVSTNQEFTTNVVEGKTTKATFEVKKKKNSQTTTTEDTGTKTATQTTTKTTNSAKTGDDSPIAGVMGIMFVSMVFVAGSQMRRKRSK